MARGYGKTVLGMLRCADNMLESRSTGHYPQVLGRDFTGEVVCVGRGVEHVCVGDKVWGAIYPSREGSHQQYCVAQADCVTAAPLTVSSVQAASIPYAGLTAWAALETARVRRGDHVLVIGGGGAVGNIAAQLLAKYFLCPVTVLASSRHHDMLTQVGVHNILDNREDLEFAAKIDQVDSVIDCAGIGIEDIRLHLPSIGIMLKRGGSFVTLSSPVLRNTDKFGLLPGSLQSMSTLLKHNSTGRYVSKWAFFQPNINALNILRKLVDDNVIIPHLAKSFPFCDLPVAYGDDKAGKMVIDFDLKTN